LILTYIVYKLAFFLVNNLLHSAWSQSVTDYLQQVAYNFASEGCLQPTYWLYVQAHKQTYYTENTKLKKTKRDKTKKTIYRNRKTNYLSTYKGSEKEKNGSWWENAKTLDIIVCLNSYIDFFSFYLFSLIWFLIFFSFSWTIKRHVNTITWCIIWCNIIGLEHSRRN